MSQNRSRKITSIQFGKREGYLRLVPEMKKLFTFSSRIEEKKLYMFTAFPVFTSSEIMVYFSVFSEVSNTCYKIIVKKTNKQEWSHHIL